MQMRVEIEHDWGQEDVTKMGSNDSRGNNEVQQWQWICYCGCSCCSCTYTCVHPHSLSSIPSFCASVLCAPSLLAVVLHHQ